MATLVLHRSIKLVAGNSESLTEDMNASKHQTSDVESKQSTVADPDKLQSSSAVLSSVSKAVCIADVSNALSRNVVLVVVSNYYSY